MSVVSLCVVVGLLWPVPVGLTEVDLFYLCTGILVYVAWYGT